MDIPHPTLRVPASTSNLGPGFDLLGLALDLPLTVTVLGEHDGPAPALVRTRGEAQGWPREGELLCRALELGARRLGLASAPLALEVHSDIPLERGFGSSGAAIVAGLVLASRLAGRAVQARESLGWALELEGHPDNVTPALLGGCTLSVPTARGLVWLRQEVHASIRIALAWPRRTLPTREARRVLPTTVPFADAVENPRRLALLLEGLRSADPECLGLGGEDRLHVPYRVGLIPGAGEALRAARDAGAWLATLSGSGSGLVALADGARVEAVADALRAELERAEPGAQARVVAIDTLGAVGAAPAG